MHSWDVPDGFIVSKANVALAMVASMLLDLNLKTESGYENLGFK